VVPHQHAVSFYDHEYELVDTVARFVAEGLAQHQRVVVVLTEPHRVAVESLLCVLGVDPQVEHRAQRYIALDAEMTLGAILDGDIPDVGRFEQSIRGFVSDAREDGSEIRMFGEMVNLLWQRGNVAGAIQLEGLWNDLLAEDPFELLCAYPSTHLSGSRLADVNAVCARHSSVAPPHSYVSGDDLGEPATTLSRVFLPVPESIAAVRRFVSRILGRWREPDLVADATLISSELATNAILHARSPFRVSVDRSVGVICISVQDAAGGLAEQQEVPAEALNGRGMAIVEALSRRWGCDNLPSGKVVWAEIGPTAG
jgi:anti-sigma regulatory factor (Ser/Thr protein kinase)